MKTAKALKTAKIKTLKTYIISTTSDDKWEVIGGTYS